MPLFQLFSYAYKANSREQTPPTVFSG